MIKTLVIQPLPGMGDMVWHIRALKAISMLSIDHQITVLTRASSQAKALFHNESWVDDIIYLDEHHQSMMGGFHLGYDLRQYQFQEVWILHHSPRYYITSKLADVAKRHGYGFGWTKHLLTSSLYLNSCDKKLHPIQKYEKFLTLYDIDVHAFSNHLSVADGYKEAVRQHYTHLPKPWITLGIGATAAARVWPTERFAELAIRLLNLTDGTVFICCAPHEASLALNIKQIVHGQGLAITILMPQQLEQTMALLSLSTCFIGNDSGLLNVAASLKIPALGIFPALGVQSYDLSLFPQVLHYERHFNGKLINDIDIEDIIEKINKDKILTINL